MIQRLDTFDTDRSDAPTVEIVQESNAPKIFTVIRRDMDNHECLVCFEGTYRKLDFDSRVRCDTCADYAPRWMTKSEMVKHSLEGQ